MKQLVRFLLHQVLPITAKDRLIISENLTYRFPFSLSNWQTNQFIEVSIKASQRSNLNSQQLKTVQSLLQNLKMMLHVSWGKCDLVSIALKY